MSRASLPALLEAFGELFLLPGAFDASCFEAALKSNWAPGSLREPLQRMLAAPRQAMDVLYAEHFLLGFQRPTVHLQASAQLSGSLLDPAILANLAGIYAVAGVETLDAVHPDHLGSMTSLLGVLLHRMQVAEGPAAEALEAASRELTERHLAPLLAKVRTGLEASSPKDPYRAAAEALASCLGICIRVLA